MSRGSHEQYVRSFKDYLVDSHRKANTINAMLTALKVYYKFIGYGGHRIEPLPEERAKSRKVLTKEQMKRLSWIINRIKTRDRAIFLTVLHAGLTPIELSRLNQDDVTFSSTGVYIQIKQDSKIKHREVRAGMTLRKALKAHFLEMLHRGMASSEPCTPLWRGRQGRRIGVGTLQGILAEIAKVLGFKVSFSLLRNVWITQQAKKAKVTNRKLSSVSGLTQRQTMKMYREKGGPRNS